MRKINWKILNLAFWIEIVLSYVLPFKVIDGFQYKAGFPIPFISVYDTVVGVSPLMSMNLNPLGLLFNGIIVYLIILFVIGIYQKFKHNRAKERAEAQTDRLN